MKDVWKVGLGLNILLTLVVWIFMSGCSANQFYVLSNVEKEIGTAEVSNEMLTKISNEMETIISNNMETIISNIMKQLGDVASIKPSADIDVDVKPEVNVEKKKLLGIF